MKLSLVVPVYNMEAYLPACLESVAAQTFGDFEVVFVNDGSTDGSLDICKLFEGSGLCPVTIVDQENSGLLAARRAGFAVARGDYLVSLDSDDALHPEALEEVKRAVDRTRADVVCYGYSREMTFQDLLLPPMDADRIYGIREVREIFCSTNKMNAIWFKAIARSCIGLEVDFSPYGRLNMGEDALQSALVFDRAESVYCIHRSLYFYRPNSQSISSRMGRYYLDDMTKVHERLVQYAKKWDVESGVDNCTRLLISRCAEEISHFALHYAEGFALAEVREALLEASNAPCIASCLINPSFLSHSSVHTRVVVRLLASKRFIFVWLLAQVCERLKALKGGDGV